MTRGLRLRIRRVGGSPARGLAALVAVLAAMALFCLPLHILTDPHHRASGVGAEHSQPTPGHDHHHHTPEPAESALGHQAASPAHRLVVFGAVAGPTAVFELVPPEREFARVSGPDSLLPAPPVLLRVVSRGPPVAVAI